MICTRQFYGQSVLDGVYVQPHIPAQKIYYTIYPVYLHYTFDDDKEFSSIIQKKINREKGKKYAEIKDCQLIDFTLQHSKRRFLEDSAKNIEDLFHPQSNHFYIKENSYPHF